jgi:hypothetical protein
MSVGFVRYSGRQRVSTISAGGSTLYSLTIDCVAGENSVTSSVLAGKTIVLVARTGVIHSPTDGTPSGRQFAFNSTTGTVSFSSTITFNANEDVLVQYR